MESTQDISAIATYTLFFILTIIGISIIAYFHLKRRLDTIQQQLKKSESELTQLRDKKEAVFENQQYQINELNAEVEQQSKKMFLKQLINNEIYILICSETTTINQQVMSFGLLNTELEKLIPFITNHDLSHINTGDQFGIINGSVKRVDANQGIADGNVASYIEQLMGGIKNVTMADITGKQNLTEDDNLLADTPLSDLYIDDEKITNQPYLKIIDGPGIDNIYYLPFKTTTLGRALSNDIVINDPEVGLTQASVEFDPYGFTFTNKNTEQAIFINDNRIEKHRLDFNDHIQIGSAWLLFSCEGYDIRNTDKKLAIEYFEQCLNRKPKFLLVLRHLLSLLKNETGSEDNIKALKQRIDNLEIEMAREVY